MNVQKSTATRQVGGDGQSKQQQKRCFYVQQIFCKTDRWQPSARYQRQTTLRVCGSNESMKRRLTPREGDEHIRSCHSSGIIPNTSVKSDVNHAQKFNGRCPLPHSLGTALRTSSVFQQKVVSCASCLVGVTIHDSPSIYGLNPIALAHARTIEINPEEALRCY